MRTEEETVKNMLKKGNTVQGKKKKGEKKEIQRIEVEGIIKVNEIIVRISSYINYI